MIGYEDGFVGSPLLRLAMCSALGVAALTGVDDALAGGYCDMSGCYVTPDPGPGGFGGMNNTGRGGWSGSGSTDAPPPAQVPSCSILLSSKPASCPNPIPFPNGYSYGRDDFPGGSGVARLIAFIEYQPHVAEEARNWVRQALSYQTTEFASFTIPFDEVMKGVKDMLTLACEKQHQADKGMMLVGNISVAEQACLTALDKISAEADGQMNFTEWFIAWTRKEGLDLSDLDIPSTSINFFTPGNSLKIKYDKVTSDAICANWWNDVKYQGCRVR